MKKIIIVCEERLRIYGDFLAQLISLQDDENDSVIGIKDDAAAAQVWTENEYSANAAQISSEQYILFIGDSKLIRDKRNFMKEKFSRYGMKYGWLGKQAALFVEDVVPIDEYDDFINFAAGYQPQIKNLLETKSDKEELPSLDNKNTDLEIQSVKAEECKPYKNEFASVEFIKNAVEDVSHKGGVAFGKVKKGINKIINDKKIEEQEYSCLVLLFYLQGLSSFLGLDEEKI